MRQVVALFGTVWALANLVLAYLFVTNAFTAKTVEKEGLLAQVLLVLGGLLIAVFALALLWQSGRLALVRQETGRPSP